mmetsp:Transcript_44820/g.108764  ORF Transcript_44820/g.108764 Transcript_44820/m.108764 type:complete len:260 (-) Transcript_44820:175-954(-)
MPTKYAQAWHWQMLISKVEPSSVMSPPGGITMSFSGSSNNTRSLGQSSPPGTLTKSSASESWSMTRAPVLEQVSLLFPFPLSFPLPPSLTFPELSSFPLPPMLDGAALADGSTDGPADGSIEGELENSFEMLILYCTVTSQTLSSNVSHGTGVVDPPTNAWHIRSISNRSHSSSVGRSRTFLPLPFPLSFPFPLPSFRVPTKVSSELRRRRPPTTLLLSPPPAATILICCFNDASARWMISSKSETDSADVVVTAALGP